MKAIKITTEKDDNLMRIFVTVARTELLITIDTENPEHITYAIYTKDGWTEIKED